MAFSLPRFVLVGGVLLAGLSVLGGYFIGIRPGGITTSPSAPPSPFASASPSVSPTAAPSAFAPPVPAATAVPTRSPAPAPSSAQPRVSFVDVPSRVRSGQSFEVRWRVEGPAGATVETTTLEMRTAQSTSSGGSNASSSSSSKQTFGGVPAPHVFSATLSLGGSARRATLTVTATVGGRTVSAGPVSIAID